MPGRLTLFVLLSSLLLLSFASLSLSNSPTSGDDDVVLDDDELSFLAEDDDDVPHAGSKHSSHSDPGDEVDDEGDEDDFGSFDDFGTDGDDEEVPEPAVDDKDVVVLKERNFTDAIENHKYVMVEFYAPWCGHCQSLAPEYASAATELKAAGDDVVLAKVDATQENELAHEFNVQGFPTVLFFVDGEHKPYNGQRTKEAIVTWIRKKVGPGVYNISTTEDAERILSSESKLVLAFLDSLVGSETKELAAASKLEDDVSFYQTMEANVAKLFNIDVEAKRPALVLLKKEAEKISHFDGEFTKSAISDFVFSNKLPLVTVFTRENAPSIFDSEIKKQLLLFASSKDSEKVLPVFQEAAKLFKGKISFVYVQLDNEDYRKTARDYFGITGDAPRLLGYVASEDVKKYVYDRELTLKRFKAFEEGFVTVKLKPVYKYLYDGMELTLERFKAFGEDFLAEKLKPFYKSDPVPETNDGDVKIVVGNNFDEIVLDESKDVLLEIYAPFRRRCQSLEPTAKHVRGIKSLVLAKIDVTTNEHPRLKAEGFPTLLFFPAGNKASDPVTVEADRTVLALYKFLKEHASIPFKCQKQMTPINKSEEGDNATTLKDEL